MEFCFKEKNMTKADIVVQLQQIIYDGGNTKSAKTLQMATNLLEENQILNNPVPASSRCMIRSIEALATTRLRSLFTRHTAQKGLRTKGIRR